MIQQRFFLKSGLTCAVLSLSGKIDTSIHLLIKNVIGSTIQGIDSFSIFGDIPSITLSENGEIINDPAKVSEVFNDFFSNVAKNIGNTTVIVNKEHPSVCMIIGSTIQGIDSFSIFGDIPS
jgi:hypothetical protein